MTRFTVGDGQNVVEHHVGRVDVSDGDKGDEVDLELQGADARAFHIFPSGDLIIAEPARLNRTIEAHLVVVAEDSGVPPRLSSVPVVVRFARIVISLILESSPGEDWSGRGHLKATELSPPQLVHHLDPLPHPRYPCRRHPHPRCVHLQDKEEVEARLEQQQQRDI